MSWLTGQVPGLDPPPGFTRLEGNCNQGKPDNPSNPSNPNNPNNPSGRPSADRANYCYICVKREEGSPPITDIRLVSDLSQPINPSLHQAKSVGGMVDERIKREYEEVVPGNLNSGEAIQVMTPNNPNNPNDPPS